MANAADGAIRYAMAQVGKPYSFGATGPNSFDCSGLVMRAYESVGINLPRTTYQQINVGSPVGKSQLQPGDLVFPDPGHVQMFIGGGKVVEAPRTGLNVRVVNMWGFWAARRVTTPGSDASGSNPLSGAVDAVTGGVGNAVGSVTSALNPFSWFSQEFAIRSAEVILGSVLIMLALQASIGSKVVAIAAPVAKAVA